MDIKITSIEQTGKDALWMAHLENPERYTDSCLICKADSREELVKKIKVETIKLKEKANTL